jgi:hypothetical protein
MSALDMLLWKAAWEIRRTHGPRTGEMWEAGAIEGIRQTFPGFSLGKMHPVTE